MAFGLNRIYHQDIKTKDQGGWFHGAIIYAVQFERR